MTVADDLADMERQRDNLVLEVERLKNGLLDHCGHIDGPCGCDESPDPTQAYYAMRERAERLRRERDEARAAIERVRALCESWDQFANGFEARLLGAVKDALDPVAPAGDVEKAAGGVVTAEVRTPTIAETQRELVEYARRRGMKP